MFGIKHLSPNDCRLIARMYVNFLNKKLNNFFRLAVFKTGLQRAFRDTRTQSLSMTRIKEFVNSNNSTPFSMGEINSAVEQMTNDNQVMLADGIVFLI